jgi:aquaporin TIP
MPEKRPPDQPERKRRREVDEVNGAFGHEAPGLPEEVRGRQQRSDWLPPDLEREPLVKQLGALYQAGEDDDVGRRPPVGEREHDVLDSADDRRKVVGDYQKAQRAVRLTAARRPSLTWALQTPTLAAAFKGVSMRKYIAEFIAAFFLVFVGAGAIISDHYLSSVRFADSFGLLGIALAHGLALAIGIAAIARISGGHANPAISIAAWVARRLNARDLAGYIVAQLLGGLLAAFLLRGLTPPEAYTEVGIGVPALGQQVDTLHGVALEIILTFFLAFTIWGVAVDRKGPTTIAPLAIGLVVTFDILAGGPFTGAAMNPARWFGPALVAGEWSNAIVWIAGPIVGALLGSLVYENFFLADQPPTEDTALDGEEGLLPEEEEELLLEDELFGAEKEPEVVEPAEPQPMGRPSGPSVTVPRPPGESPPLRPPPTPGPPGGAPTRPEPMRPQPGRPEPGGGPEPMRPQPGRPEPGRPEPGGPEPGRPEPMRPQPGRPEPRRPEPMRPQPGRPEPGRPEPMRPQPGRPEPGRPEPGRPEPMRPQPGRPEPGRSEPPRPGTTQPPRPGTPQPHRPESPPSGPPGMTPRPDRPGQPRPEQPPLPERESDERRDEGPSRP